jgi:hypothetical protein
MWGLFIEQAWISFAACGDPNKLGDLSPGVTWPQYENVPEQVLVFQKLDGSALGSTVGQGLHTEKDVDGRPVCDFIISEVAQFIH